MQEMIPRGVVSRKFTIKPPLIKPSRLTSIERGGVGKNLSTGWTLNFFIGCTMGCVFCYVDQIEKQSRRVGNIVTREWGYYLGVPENMDEAIEKTPWSWWRGEEVLLCSTHDPYMPVAFTWTRKILEKALPAGVRFCIQTRSPLVERDFNLFKQFREQVRVQVSIATYNDELSRLIEPRTPPPRRRMETIRKAKSEGITTGIIIAPVFPPVRVRQDVKADLSEIFKDLAEIRPDHIYGECLHIRGMNLTYLEKRLGEPVRVNRRFDKSAGQLFQRLLLENGLKGEWWYDRWKRGT